MLHCKDMKHHQKVFFARTIAKQKVRFFGVISLKETLKGYKEEINANPKVYYNKCAKYLLERVGMFLKDRGISKENFRVIFEEGNFEYASLRNYIRTCQNAPYHKDSTYLTHMNAESIGALPKAEEPLLKIADLVAHALFKCVDKNKRNFCIPEPRYLSELAPRFFGHPETERVEGAGIKAIHSLNDLKLDKDVSDIIDGMKAGRPQNLPNRKKSTE